MFLYFSHIHFKGRCKNYLLMKNMKLVILQKSYYILFHLFIEETEWEGGSTARQQAREGNLASGDLRSLQICGHGHMAGRGQEMGPITYNC